MRTFKPVQNEDKIKKLSFKNFSEQSRRKIKWAVNMYCQWRSNRLVDSCVPQQIRFANIDYLNEFTQEDLCFALCRFITEVKKVDNTDYPLNTVREIIIMLQMHLHRNSIHWKLLDGAKFQVLRNVLDNTMKERTAQGLGIRKSSSVISLFHEDKMFATGALGESEPDQLL